MEKEEELIKRAKKKDKEAFEKLIEIYRKNLYITAKTILRNYTDADDAVQETLFNVYKNLKYLKEEKYFKTWIFRILINNCLDICRKNKNEILPFNEYVIDKIGYSEMENNLDFLEMIDFLDENDKIIIIMKYSQNYRITDICENLNLSESAVKMRLSRAKEKIKEKYEGKIF